MAERGGLSVAAAVVVSANFYGCFGATAQDRPGLSSRCGGEQIELGNVTRVVDGRNFALNDGRTVHLAGVEVPLLPLPGQPGAPPGGAAAKAALAILLLGARIELRRAEFTSDRYGRLVAYVDAIREHSDHLVQAQLISTGFARVGGDIDNARCGAELLRLENAAREVKLGLWSSRYYQVLRAKSPEEISARLDHFALVEGTVVSVHESGATIYVNFGQHWSDDFAFTVRKRDEQKFAAAGVDLKQLAGRRVRVRGWVGVRGASGALGAPWIEVNHPEQIELVNLK